MTRAYYRESIGIDFFLFLNFPCIFYIVNKNDRLHNFFLHFLIVGNYFFTVAVHYGFLSHTEQFEKAFSEFAVLKLFDSSLRTAVRDDFNIHGAKYFYDAVFHQK